ncbi:MAG: hypothetical protein ACRDHS_04175 [Actinomycetota bacterium]
MSTKAGAIGLSTRPAWFPLWTALVSGLAVAALIMSALALNLAVRGDERAAVPAPRKAITSGSAITGTGPGLVQVAQEAARAATLPRIYSDSAITGTGPGLTELAEEASTATLLHIYSGSRVTGTGPGLAVVAPNHSQPQVTGTGPGLVQVAEWTGGE